MSAIKRLEKPHFLTLAAALDLSKGTTIDGIERLAVLDVKERKTGADGDGKPWTCQAMKVRQAGTESWLSVFDFPDLSFLNGSDITLESTVGGNGKTYGLTIDEYKGERKLKLSDSGLVDHMAEKEEPQNQKHNMTAHGIGAGAAARERPRQQEAAPARNQRSQDRGMRDQPDSGQTRQPDNIKTPIRGDKVGMCIKEANLVLLHLHQNDPAYFFSPRYAEELGWLASDIVRVSQYMESGHLAPSAKARAKAGQQASDAPDEQESRPARQPRATRDEPPTGEYAEEDAPADTRNVTSYKDEMEEDSIPF